jgi:hydroxymethylpyrimidine/phosphomethylpyrimidine kinase
MQQRRKNVISIAGFDPSGGAGILSDIKTFENLDVCGMGVCTALTIQHEDAIRKVRWISNQEILEQLDWLLEKYPVGYLKIGLIESLSVLNDLLSEITGRHAGIKIIWDPIMRSSSGFDFHSNVQKDLVLSICEKIFLITPNCIEAMKLMTEQDGLAAARGMGKKTNVLLKSYSGYGKHCDILCSAGADEVLETNETFDLQKHGSGCVLSAAITAFLAREKELGTACRFAKDYTAAFLKSEEGLLGSHLFSHPVFNS